MYVELALIKSPFRKLVSLSKSRSPDLGSNTKRDIAHPVLYALQMLSLFGAVSYSSFYLVIAWVVNASPTLGLICRIEGQTRYALFIFHPLSHSRA